MKKNNQNKLKDGQPAIVKWCVKSENSLPWALSLMCVRLNAAWASCALSSTVVRWLSSCVQASRASHCYASALSHALSTSIIHFSYSSMTLHMSGFLGMSVRLMDMVPFDDDGQRIVVRQLGPCGGHLHRDMHQRVGWWAGHWNDAHGRGSPWHRVSISRGCGQASIMVMEEGEMK